MIASKIFTQILGLKEIEVVFVEMSSTHYHFRVRSIFAETICPKCGKKCSKVKSYHNRKIRDLPISGKKVYLDLEVRQFECDCGNFYTEPFQFVRSYKRLTIRYEDYLYYRCKGAEVKYVSTKEEVDWKTVNEIFTTLSTKEILTRSSWKDVTHIALDEIALRKGHKNYVVVVLDLLTGHILDILKQRDKAFLVKYFQDIGEDFCNQIKVFSSDMWKAYLNCAKEVFSNAIVVADRFHFFGKCQEGMNHARNSFRKTFPKSDELKKLKYALLKDPENLSDKQQKQLNKVFEKKQYHLLRLTWDARNLLRDIFNCPYTIKEAEPLIEEWIENVKKFKIRYFFKFIDFYREWKTVILNYFDGRFSTGKLEGTNNKLKLIKRRAYGFLDFESFKARAMVEFY